MNPDEVEPNPTVTVTVTGVVDGKNVVLFEGTFQSEEESKQDLADAIKNILNNL